MVRKEVNTKLIFKKKSTPRFKMKYEKATKTNADQDQEL